MMDRIEAEGRAEVDAGRSAAVPPCRPHPALDRVVVLAADLFTAPAAVLVLRSRDRAVVLAAVGLDAVPSSLAWGFPLSDPAPLAISDLVTGFGVSLVTGAPPRFYAAAPVVGADGAPLGTLCVMAPEPRPDPSPADIGRLALLAALAGDAIEADRARERAEATADGKAWLLADVSHEMRTPLNAIVGFTQLLGRDGALEGEALRAVERIGEAGRGLLNIVGDALDLSRFESGLVRLDVRAFSPSRVIDDAVAMVRADAERKGLRLVVDVPAGAVGPLIGDPDRLRQVVLNLLSNAVKFTASGTVRIALGVGRSLGGAVPLTISVEDSGIGITADGIPRLFRRFAQADGSVARRFGGNGLGLAISKSLVEAMGGSITVESVAGEGARFAVSLVLSRAVDVRPVAPPCECLPADRDGLRGLAILVADDAAMNQKLVVQMLEPFGADVDVVADGAAAVAAVGRRDYALVLMDMEMPVLGGLDAARQIRALDGPAGALPIVALTANVFPEQLDLCRQAGMDDHLTKPFGADELAAKALRWARRLIPAAGDRT